MLTEEDKQWIHSALKDIRESTVNDLKKEINELTLKLQAQNSKILSLERRLTESAEREAAKDAKLAAQEIKHDDLEQYGRRFGIRVENIPYVDKEQNEDLWPKLVDAFSKLKIDIQPNDVARYHRTGKPRTNRDGKYVRQCIVKFVHWSSREKFKDFNKNARRANLDTRVNNDLTARRLTLLNQARDLISSKMLQAGEFTADELKGKNGFKIPDEKNVFVYVTMNSDLCIRGRKEIFKFNTKNELDNIINRLF